MSRWAGALGPGLKPQRLPAGPAPLSPFLNSQSETRGSQGLAPPTLICCVGTSTEHLVGDITLCPYGRSWRMSAQCHNEEAAQTPKLSTEERWWWGEGGWWCGVVAGMEGDTIAGCGEMKARRADSPFVPSNWRARKGPWIPGSSIPVIPWKP